MAASQPALREAVQPYIAGMGPCTVPATLSVRRSGFGKRWG